jgi:hypothetical protein
MNILQSPILWAIKGWYSNCCNKYNDNAVRLR